MKKQGIEDSFWFMKSRHLVKFFTILLFLSGSVFAADAPDTDKSAIKDTAKYQGTLSGKWSGESMGVVVNGTFSINISADGIVSGTFSGPQSGTITGTISESGEINAKGSAGFSDWSGNLNLVNGHLSGSGTWTGYGGITGSWSSN